jgi:hypothetical protein
MKSSYFTNEDQLQQWIEAAESIQERFGLEKALGYLIGEKFYNVVSDNLFSRKMIRIIAEEKKQPDYNPVREYGEGRFKRTVNLDEQFKEYEARVIQTEQILIEFASMIKDTFHTYEIKSYFDSNPRLGAHGHTTTEEQHDFLIQHGAIEHSIETEVEDALIFGDMMKYLQG